MQAPGQRQLLIAVGFVLLFTVVAVFLHRVWNPTVTGDFQTKNAGRMVPRFEKPASWQQALQKQVSQQQILIKQQQQQLEGQQKLLENMKQTYKKQSASAVATPTAAASSASASKPGVSDRIKIYAPTELSSSGMQKAKLRVKGGTTPIYVYNYQDLISRTILQSQAWEAPQMAATTQLLMQDKDMHFIDFGCNLGVYTILSAKLGRKVVAVDANIENLKRLRRSLMDAGLEKQTTLLLNAIHKDHHSYKLRHHPTNIGGDSIYEVAEGTSGAVKSVTMDEILAVTPFRKALLKLDIEGTEFVALHAADRFFREMTIPVIFMEWGVINRDNRDGKQQAWILKFFKTRGFAPYANAHSSAKLSDDHFRWPWDIVWKKA